MTDLLSELQQCIGLQPSEILGRSIDLLLAQLDPARGRLLRLCAVPHQLDPGIVHALDPSLGADATEQYQSLCQYAIVTSTPDGLALHDDARRHLFTHWLREESRAEFEAVSARLAAHFAERAADVTQVREVRRDRERVFHLIGADQGAGFGDFESMCRAERRRSRLTSCRTLINLVHEYDAVLSPDRLTRLAYHEGKLAADLFEWEQADSLLRLVVDRSEASDVEMAVKALRRIGLLSCERREWVLATHYLERALDLANGREVLEFLVPRLLRDLGVVQRDLGEFDTAERLLTKSIADAERRRDDHALASSWNSLGVLFLRRRDTSAAVGAFQTAETYVNSSDVTIRTAQLMNNTALAYLDTADWANSREYFGRSLAIKQDLGDTRGRALTLGNLAVLHERVGDNDQSVQDLRLSIALFLEVHDYFDAAMSARNLGRLYRRLNALDSARNAFTDAIRYLERGNDTEEAASCRREHDEIGAVHSIPWWAWLCLALVLLSAAGIAALVLIAMAT